jgi:hypothetical protein
MCPSHSCTLKTEVISSFETLVCVYQIARYYIVRDNLPSHRRGNIRSSIMPVCPCVQMYHAVPLLDYFDVTLSTLVQIVIHQPRRLLH